MDKEKSSKWCIFENKICIYACNNGNVFECNAPSDEKMICK